MINGTEQRPSVPDAALSVPPQFGFLERHPSFSSVSDARTLGAG